MWHISPPTHYSGGSDQNCTTLLGAAWMEDSWYIFPESARATVAAWTFFFFFFFADRKIIALKIKCIYDNIYVYFISTTLKKKKKTIEKEVQCLMHKWFNETVFPCTFHITLKDKVGLKLLSRLQQVHFRASASPIRPKPIWPRTVFVSSVIINTFYPAIFILQELKYLF